MCARTWLTPILSGFRIPRVDDLRPNSRQRPLLVNGRSASTITSSLRNLRVALQAACAAGGQPEMSAAADVRLVVDAQNLCGESPVWDVREQRILWADSPAGEIWSCLQDGGNLRRWYTPSPVGSFALRAAGGAILALADGFYIFDFDSLRFARIGDPESG